MNMNCPAAHRGEESALIEVAHNRVRVKELWGSSEIIAVGFLSPTTHWAPSRALEFEAPCLIRHVDNTVGDVV